MKTNNIKITTSPSSSKSVRVTVASTIVLAGITSVSAGAVMLRCPENLWAFIFAASATTLNAWVTLGIIWEHAVTTAITKRVALKYQGIGMLGAGYSIIAQIIVAVH